MQMMVKEITVKIYLNRTIKVSDAQGAIVRFLDEFLVKDEKFAQFHEANIPKGYTHDLLYPLTKGMSEYKGDNIYQFRVRTVNEELAAYLLSGIADHKTNEMKGLARTVKVIPHKHISQVYTLTPMILVAPEGKGYWRDCMTFEAFEEMLQKSMIDQYEKYTGETVGKNCPLYDQIELKNKCAIGVPYKGITLLGDKLSLQVADNETAQRIIYYTLASGLGTKGSRGMGFLGYRFL